MTEKDVLSILKTSIREELDREANEVIEKLCHKFRCELGKHKNKLIAEMIHRIDIVTSQEPITNEVVFQINIRGNNNKE